MENLSAPLTSLLMKEPSHAIPYVVLTALVSGLGVVGNLLILVVYLSNKELRKTGNEFIVNLAISDLCVTGFANPMCIIGVVAGEEFFQDRPWLCELTACVCLTACFSALLSLTTMTFNRYLFVCHKGVHNVLFRRRSVNIASCLLLWVVGFGLEVGNFLGWGRHVFDKKYHSCIWDRVASMSYTVTVGLLITCPLLIMLLSHILIFRHIRQAKFKIHASQTNPSDKIAKKKAWMETMRSSRVLLIVFCAVAICWSPYTILILMDMGDKYSFELHLWVTWLAHLHSAVNFPIYSVTQRSFRSGLRHLVKRTHTTSTVSPSPPENIVKVQPGPSRETVFHKVTIKKLEARGPYSQPIEPDIK